MKREETKVLLAFLMSLGFGIVQAQESLVFKNEGKFYISSGSLVSTTGDFVNSNSGDFINDGSVYYFSNFSNDGIYDWTRSKKTSKAYFHSIAKSNYKSILGNNFASFYDVEFNSDLSDVAFAFALKNNIDIYGQANFANGIILVDDKLNPETKLSYGMISFMPKASYINADDSSYVDGLVEKKGNEAFTFPVGKSNMFRPSHMTAPSKSSDIFTGEYFYKDPKFFETRPTTAGIIKELNRNEYWLIDRGNNITSDVLVTLSWDNRSTPLNLLTDPEHELHVVRWDSKQQLWVDEGGVVDMSEKTITTPLNVKGLGIFTLATVKKDWAQDGNVVIYNLVSPNGDGKNDYFIVDNIHRYPNNRVEIFNRWGEKVYETSNYDPLGDGSSNVFTGYSEGRVTIDKNKLLPSGTYYYIVTYEYTDDKGTRMIKKAANLHLETH